MGLLEGPQWGACVKLSLSVQPFARSDTCADLVTVTVMEFPDDETATAVLLQVGSVGNVRSNTMRAFSADEMTTIIGKTG